MGKFAFVSDFDGTLTEKDFYHILIDKYIGEEGRQFYRDWKAKEKINVSFLNQIFKWSGLNEEALKEEILQIPFDAHGIELIEEVRNRGGDFYIVSAGTAYYIRILLKYLGLENIPVISMEAAFVDGHLEIQPDHSDPYFSELFGVDKGKVIESLRQEMGYDFIYFAGDSEPDLTAGKKADLCFGKNELDTLMEKNGIQHISVKSCEEILDYIQKI